MTPAASLARPLSSLKTGEHGLVIACRVEGADAPILRAMGLTEGAVVRVCRAGEPTIVALLCHRGCHCASSRVGLARALADRVMVTDEPVPQPGANGAGEGHS
ncbi:MAG: FeoA family protein [Phycisphaerales bacterium]